MNEGETFVHPTAVVHEEAVLDTGVYIGPHSVIGSGVSIGKNTRIDAGVNICGPTEIGEECRFSPFSSIGTEPQDVQYKGEETRLVIGRRNVFREFITVHRGSPKDKGITVIGDDNYFMAYSHVAHDCIVGNEVVFINGATLAGHVTVHDHATVGAFSAVHQFCRVGVFAFIGGYSVITQDVLPFCRVAGARPTLLYGVNAVGLRRKGYSRERIKAVKDIHRIFFHSGLNTTEAVKRIEEECPPSEERRIILDFIATSKRGIVKKAGGKWDAPAES